MIASDLSIVLPELLLAVFAMIALLAVVFTGKDKMASLTLYATVGALLAVAVMVAIRAPGGEAFGGMFIDDGFSQFAKVMILLSAASVLLMSHDYMRVRDLLRFEYPLLVALAVVGMMVMVSAGDLIALYMGLELQSLALYVVASLRRDSVRSTEAGLKYFVLGALSSGLLLYGASLTYGYTGSTLFAEIVSATGEEPSVGLLLGLVFIVAGLAFKVSAAPFHMWTPDVYEGSPAPVTAFFATAPKIAAMALFARVVHDAFGGIVGDWQQVIAALAVVSMFLGAIAAIGQRNIKRLMAYSSIAHMGFALMGLAAGTAFGVQAMLIYMAVYVTMNIAAFAFILMMERDGQLYPDIDALQNYSQKEPTRALAMLVVMFSLAGAPPFLGFWAKLYVLQAAYQGGLVWLVIAGVIASVIGAFYYLRIVYFMYFGKETDILDRTSNPVLHGFLVAGALVLVIGVVNFLGVEGFAAEAAASLVN
ncbi:MAG: NADH-quinone oxidoreductase subunit NuoN [Shimia sp.]